MSRAMDAFARSSPTRSIVAAAVALACLGAASPTSADLTLKLGGSAISNWSSEARQGTIGLRQAGAHASLDIRVPERAIVFSPFLDIYHRLASGDRPRNNMSTNMIGGLNFLFFTGSRERDKVTMYLGAGGGAARTKVSTDTIGGGGASNYKTRVMADALMGLEVKVAKRVSFFFEPHYVWAPKILNGVSAHAGLAFRLNKVKAVAEVRPATPARIYAAPAQKAPAPFKAVEPVTTRAADTGSLDEMQMQEMIYFPNDQSDISDDAKTVLNDKVALFRSNPEMRIVIVGFASQPGTEAYNMALGLRRAEAAKAYLVSEGVDATRIEIATRGENQLMVEGPGELADEQNRRDQFRLLITDPLAAPRF